MALLGSKRSEPTTSKRHVYVHADKSQIRDIENGEEPIFRKLRAHLAKHDVLFSAVHAGSRPAQKALSENTSFNLMLEQPAQYGPRIMHLSRAPILGFWRLDELGTGHDSGLRLAEFDPNTIDGDKAEYFFNGVTGYMLRENVSPRAQADRLHNGLLGAKAAVFCQPEQTGDSGVNYLSTENMIRITAEHVDGGLVYVKPHPMQSKEDRRLVLETCRDYQNVTVSEASIHDLIQASDVVVTQNSNVGFEALMHKCPVVTCAKSNYWHGTLTARNRTDLKQALSYAGQAMLNFPYEKYFYWSLVRHGLEPEKDNFAQRTWARMREKSLW